MIIPIKPGDNSLPLLDLMPKIQEHNIIRVDANILCSRDIQDPVASIQSHSHKDHFGR